MPDRRTVAFLSAGLVCASLAAGRAGTDAALADAVQQRNARATAALLAGHADVNKAQPDGGTPLHWAVHWNNLELVHQLLKAGARVNVVNALGVTPLSLACTNGSAEAVSALVNAGADVGAARPTGETPLMTCARSGNAAAVQALVARGANVAAREPVQGQTALMWAAAQNHGEVVRLLIEAGAEVRGRTSTATGFTPLLFAAREGAAEAARILLAKGAPVDEAALDGTTPLMAAVYSGHWDLATYMLEQGADPNADAAGYTALHWAAGSWDTVLSKSADQYLWLAARGPGKVELVQALLKHGANPNARMKKFPPGRGGNSNGNGSDLKVAGLTPFMLAAKAADVRVMRALLEAGADPRARSDDNTSALMTAAGMGQPLIMTRVTHEEAAAAVALALDVMGKDTINWVNNDGESALHAAAYFGVENVAQYLVDHGAEVNPRNKLGFSPTTIADGYGGHSGVVIHARTASTLKKAGGIGGVEMPEMQISMVKTPCPLPVVYFPIRNPGMYGNLFLTTTEATEYVGGSCEDLKAGTRVRVNGVREIGVGKAWDGSVLATRIEIVK
jgi:ankyrin repeat protein